MTNPALSIVLPAYNAGAFIGDAIAGVLSQTYSDFELVVVNDGSTDNTLEVIQQFNDPRISILTQANAGLVASLNTAIKAARGVYIARHDADDYSEPTRLERQVKHLQDHPNVVLIGSSMQVMDMSSKRLHNHYVLLSDPELKQELLVRSPFAHGSVMFRKAAWEAAGGYQQSDWPAEDYGLWVRMAEHGEFANIDEPLYVYRENTGGISAQNQRAQSGKTMQAQRHAATRLKLLTPQRINTDRYKELAMGQFRITRITQNVLSGTAVAIRHGNLFGVFASLRLLLENGDLRRKCARLILVKIGVKHD